MYYSYQTDAGSFVLERQLFTDSTWQLLFNGKFVDSYRCPMQAARDLLRHSWHLGITDTLLMPPTELAGWEIHWAKRHGGEAAEVWLHQLYTEGRAGARVNALMERFRSPSTAG